MLRYALYARKSKEDKSGLIKSIEDQKDIWQQLASQLSLHVEAVFEENKTAKLPGARPIYQQMIAAIKAGKIEGILVWHINRLARNMEEGGSLAQMLIDGKLKEIRTPHSIYRPGDNILPLLLEQGMSAQYSLDLSENVRRGMNSMVATGGWPHQAKVGYLNARDPQNANRGIIVKDPDRFDLMRRAFDLMLTGRYSVRRLVEIMNRDWGFRTRTTPTRPDSPLSYAAAYDIFASPFYAGFTVHNGVQRKGNHPAMITISEYNRLQDILRQKRRQRHTPREMAYTGIMRCGHCGYQITAEVKKKGATEYIYYHCSDTKLQCTKRGMNEKDLEDSILQHLQSVTVDPIICNLALQNIARWLEVDDQSSEMLLKSQEQALKQLEDQRKKLLDLLLKGMLTDEALYRAKEKELNTEQNRLLEETEETRQARDHMRQQAQAGINYIQYARLHFTLAPPWLKKEIARTLGAEYVLREKEIMITIDPLLKELVDFSDQIMAALEPKITGSESRYQADFSSVCHDGRGAQTLIELPSSLINALQQSHMRDLFVQMN